MSLILDALNKADRERQATDAPPGIHTVHDTQEFKPGKPIWFYITVVAFSLSVLLLLAFLLLRDSSTPTENAAPAPAPAAVSTEVQSDEQNDPEPTAVVAAPVTPPSEQAGEQAKKSTSIPGLPKPVLVEKEKPATTNKSAINELYKQQVETVKTEEEVATTDSSSREAGTASATQTAEPKSEQTRQADSHTAQAVARQESHKQAAAAVVVQEKLADHPDVPFVNDLPWSVINNLPSLSYSSHIYVKGGERKQVVLNNQSKDEGQRLDENIQVEKIVKDGVILEYQGYRFKLKALNSWVNI